jgi:hypothetical protein
MPRSAVDAPRNIFLPLKRDTDIKSFLVTPLRFQSAPRLRAQLWRGDDRPSRHRTPIPTFSTAYGRGPLLVDFVVFRTLLYNFDWSPDHNIHGFSIGNNPHIIVENTASMEKRDGNTLD